MDIKDYLHLYLGQECQTPTRVYNDEIHGPSYKLRGRIMDIDLVIDQVGVHLPGSAETDLNTYAFSEIKLILRPLSDMTNDEKEKLFEIAFNSTGFTALSYDPIEDVILADHKNRRVGIQLKSLSGNMFIWCLSKAFDLFGLIESGLAIDKTKKL